MFLLLLLLLRLIKIIIKICHLRHNNDDDEKRHMRRALDRLLLRVFSALLVALDDGFFSFFFFFFLRREKNNNEKNHHHHKKTLTAKKMMMPRHIAFVMDGNRRWEEKEKKRRRREGGRKGGGHERGAETLRNVLEWSLETSTHIETISVYAFSIDNFKRHEGEIDRLMRLCAQELPKLARSEGVKKAKAKIVVSGRLDLVPKEVREACIEAMEKTKENAGKVVLNVCLAYSGAEEFGRAVWRDVEEEHNEKSGGVKTKGESDEERMKRRFYYGDREKSNNTCASRDSRIAGRRRNRRSRGRENGDEKEEEFEALIPNVDLIVRTSGTKRLSDFMTTRLENAVIVFVDALWPDFGVFDFFSVIWRYRKASSILRENMKKREMKEG